MVFSEETDQAESPQHEEPDKEKQQIFEAGKKVDTNKRLMDQEECGKPQTH